MESQKIILASSSPRRIEIMRDHSIEPVILPPDVDETIPPELSPQIAVMFLALKKALCSESAALKNGYINGEILIAADTVVVHENTIIGKPADSDEAFGILKRLCGREHSVITGVAILVPGKPIRKAFYVCTKVHFKNYTDDEIISYVNTPEPYDKAGGYAIQGAFGKYIDHIDGDFHNVMGFPWDQIVSSLKQDFSFNIG